MGIQVETCHLLKEAGFIVATLTYEKLVANAYIDGRYAHCAEDSINRHINRHDKLHAMTVTSNAFRMFYILKDERSLRRFMDPMTGGRAFGFSILTSLTNLYGIVESLAEDFTCACILVSAFCHDLFRFMMKDHPAAATLFVSRIAEKILPPILNPEMTTVGYERFMSVIEGCVYKHEGAEEALNAEEGIVMLADAIDNDENRVKKASPREVILEDPRPIEYFSCLNIVHPVLISKGTSKKVDLTVRLKGDAGWHHVHQIHNVLRNSKLGAYVSLFVCPPGDTERVEI